MKIEELIEQGRAAEPVKTSAFGSCSKTIQIAGGFGLFLFAVALPAVADLSASAGAAAGSFVLAALLATLSAFDIRFYRLPDALTVPMGLLGLLFCHLFHWDGVAIVLRLWSLDSWRFI